MQNNIAIFPGTFNPIHKGHLLIAQMALDKFKLKKIYFVLSPSPPNKISEHNILSTIKRAKLIEAALKNKDQFELSLIELEYEGLSYTIETIKYFKNKFCLKEKLKIILGFDAFLSLPSWYKSEEIKEMAFFLVALRNNNILPTKLEGFYNDLDYALLDNPLIDISASEIRNRKKQKHNYQNLLTAEVFELYDKQNIQE